MWKQPPLIKIYEALGAVADGRIEIDGNNAKCFSSSKNKYYEVTYDKNTNSIMTNDNGSYWKGYLGYPAIAFLLKKGTLEYKSDLANLLKDIKWKDINQEFKNDFDKTVSLILETIDPTKRKELEEYAIYLSEEINKLKLALYGKKKFPPKGY